MRFCTLACALLAAANLALSQSHNSRLEGAVTDPQGAAVPGAMVRVPGDAGRGRSGLGDNQFGQVAAGEGQLMELAANQR